LHKVSITCICRHSPHPSASVSIHPHRLLFTWGCVPHRFAGLPLTGNPACLLFTTQEFKVFVSTFLTYWIFITPVKFWEFNKENKVTDLPS